MTLLLALTLFTLAVFLGLELISKVPATLHTPLMSGSNAISGITLIGALVAAGADHSTLAHHRSWVLCCGFSHHQRSRWVCCHEPDAFNVHEAKET